MTHPIHIFRFCPRCGSSMFPAVSDRSFRCGECDFQYFINSSAAVAALIFNKEGKLLLTRRAFDPDKGKYDLPGGFVDPGESAEEALIRELKEELGIEVKSLKYVTSKANEYYFSGITIFTTDFAFKAEAVSLENIHACDDISGFEWVDPDAIDPAEIPALSIRYFVKEMATNG
jgi:NAD+ diphosphatase